MARNLNGIFCLEGDWQRNLDSVQSMKPILDLLRDTKAANVIHRDVASRADLSHYVDRWLRRKSEPLGVFAFHGSPMTLHLGAEDISLAELQEMLSGRCHDRVIYMGSCDTLKADDSVLKEFCRVTGARGLAGYTSSVDFIEAAAFELLMLYELAYAIRMKPVYTRLAKNYPDLVRRLGFKVATSSWVISK